MSQTDLDLTGTEAACVSLGHDGDGNAVIVFTDQDGGQIAFVGLCPDCASHMAEDMTALAEALRSGQDPQAEISTKH